MKTYTSLLIFTLVTLSGCGTKEKKDQPKTEVTSVSEITFQHIENLNDTTLPTETKTRNSALEIINEPTQPEVIE